MPDRTYLLIPATGEPSRFPVPASLAAELDLLQRTVGGALAAVDALDGHTLYVNAAARTLGADPNPVASELARTGYRLLDHLAGDAILAGPFDDDGRHRSTATYLQTTLGAGSLDLVPGGG